MTATILDGRPIAAAIWDDVANRATTFEATHARSPRLAIARGGHDPGSVSYLRQIERAFGARGVATTIHTLPDGADEPVLADLLRSLAADDTVDGVLVQLPLPSPLTLETLYRHLPASKDVEGLHPLNAGALAQKRTGQVPSTALAGMEVLRASDVSPSGKTAVVVGRSQIVGSPFAQLLLHANATVVICHSRTPDLGLFTRQADILAAATGRPGLIQADMVKPGAVVLDFGTNVVDGKLVGDVDFEAAREVAGLITPVPGGIGPVTTAVLARNLLDLADRFARRGGSS